MPSDGKIIYLTFDDGPHPEITGRVLDLLELHDAKATFFCVGENVQRFPDMYSRILSEGHRTGNHTFNHLNGWKTHLDPYLDNTRKAGEYISSDLFRPPYGKIGYRQMRALAKKYRIIMWSLLSRDFEPDLTISDAKEALLKHSKAGSIVLFHDSAKAEQNLKKLLPWYLETMKERGFTFKIIA